ncbi:hypothetical protein V8C42DRAFT_358019 [Trichoderma barbatum]
MDQTSWLDLSSDGDIIPTSPSPPPSPPSSPVKLTRSRSIIERAASRASEYSISPNTSHSDDRLVGRSGLPPWDRTVDIVYHKYKHGDAKPDKSQRFPENIRRLILEHFVASHEALGSKPISLNRFCWDQDCWEPSDFTPLNEVFMTFRPYLGVSFGFYATIFVTILSEFTFHVTFSPFIARRLNPLATTWLNKYGRFMRSLIIEVDLSRLGLGPAPEAVDLLPGITQLQRLLFDFSLSQLERSPEVPLETLILACRRFHGQREDVPYISTEALESTRASSASPQNQCSSVESSGRLPSSDISDITVRAVSPAPEEFFEQTELDLEDYGDEYEEEEEEDEYANSDMDSDDGYVLNMSFDSSDYSSYSSSSSDSSSNPDISLAPPSIQQEDLSYCPDKHLFVCNHLLRLQNKVTSLRMTGFSDAYTHAFIATLFPEAKFLPAAQHSYRVAPSTLWPRLRGQKSWIDAGQGTLILDDHGVIPEPCIFPEGPIQLPPPTVYKSSIRPMPWCPEQPHRPRNNTVSSGSSLPSQRSLESNEEANTSKRSRSSYEKSKVQKLLDKYKEKSRRRPRPISAP